MTMKIRDLRWLLGFYVCFVSTLRGGGWFGILWLGVNPMKSRLFQQ